MGEAGADLYEDSVYCTEMTSREMDGGISAGGISFDVRVGLVTRLRIKSTFVLAPDTGRAGATLREVRHLH